MERFTGKVTGPNSCGHAVPVTFAMDFVFGMTDRDYLQFQALLDRLCEYEETGLTPKEITTMATEIETRFLSYVKRKYGLGAAKLLDVLEAAKHGRLFIVPAPGDVLYETDPEHGVVKHTVTDVHWVSNTSAVDDNGMAWADYYTEEDIETAHPTREAAEAVLAAGSIMEG